MSILRLGFNNIIIMLSHLDEQMLVEQIEEEQQEKEIETLLRRYKKKPAGMARDAVYNQLYVDWGPAGKTRRTKTEINLSNNVSRARIKRKREEPLTTHQKKYHSQSV